MNVNMGATTIWERWNSILQDGSISDTGMNSLNHYAYGSIVEWIYRDVCGIQPLEEAPGFRRFCLAPKPERSLGHAHAVYHSPAGKIESGWHFEQSTVHYRFVVPFGASAQLALEGETPIELQAGEYNLSRNIPATNFDLETPISAVISNEQANQALTEILPELPEMMMFKMLTGERSMQDLIAEGFVEQDDPRLKELIQKWKKI